MRSRAARGVAAGLFGCLVAVGITPTANAVESDPIVGSESDVFSSEPAPYVMADSPAEAEQVLDALETGDSSMGVSAASVQYGPCVLYPSVIYLRKSTDYTAVGFKPYTTCSVPVTSIHHDSDLRYKWYLWWRKAGTWSGGNRYVASYTQKNIAYTCKGTNSTTWGGTTLGTIVYGGKTYYARVYPPQNKLACKA